MHFISILACAGAIAVGTVKKLAGQDVRLKFELTAAKLCAFAFSD